MHFPNAKPCPFCGGTELDIERKELLGTITKQVACLDCGACGPKIYRAGNLPSDYERIQFSWDRRKER